MMEQDFIEGDMIHDYDIIWKVVTDEKVKAIINIRGFDMFEGYVEKNMEVNILDERVPMYVGIIVQPDYDPFIPNHKGFRAAREAFFYVQENLITAANNHCYFNNDMLRLTREFNTANREAELCEIERIRRMKNGDTG